MGNIQIPFCAFPENIRVVTIEKRLFICKMLSISACIVSTAVYIRPVDLYFNPEFFGIFLPGFIAGYIIINSSEIVAMYIDEPHIFLEVSFAAIGSFANGLFSALQFFGHIDWSRILVDDLTEAINTQKFILALACLVNSIALLLVVIIRGIQKQLSRMSMSLEN